MRYKSIKISAAAHRVFKDIGHENDIQIVTMFDALASKKSEVKKLLAKK